MSSEMDAVAMAADRLEGRSAAADRYPTPHDLARALDPRVVRTPALSLLDQNLMDVAEGRCKRLIWTMPPQEGKSQRVSRTFPAWMLARDPDKRIAIASYELGTARRWGRAIRNDIRSNREKFDLRIRNDTSSAQEWQLEDHAGGVYSVGVAGALTGRPVDILIIDDPIKDRAQAESEVFRERVWDFWTDTARTRFGADTAVIVVLTRWHEDDLAGRLIRQDVRGEWRHVNIPAEADHDPAKGQIDALGREPGAYLLSARGRTPTDWEHTKQDVGSRTWTSLYQGHPSPDSGNVWKRQWWRRYGTPLWSQHPTLPDAYTVHEVDQLIMTWDMAFKDTKSSDYVVGQVWARRGADVFLLDQIRKRLSFTDTLAAFQGMVARWPGATAKLVEDKANGTAVISTLKSKIPGIIAVTPTESKYARANAVAPPVEAGNAFLPEKAIALFDPDEFIDEAAGFPNGTHDDQVDAASQGLAYLLLDQNGAMAWINHYRAKIAAAAAAAAAEAAEDDPEDEPEPAQEPATAPEQAEAPEEPEQPADVPEDPAVARKRARDAALRNRGQR
ncbi:phage terminase large subunit [Streptomyces scabiei]|uniref:phage terminase large subunit n=1 Tax=Streptomyces scabiei TaxID=1930 RepID=UPI0027E0703D|nr:MULTISPECIES: phage terminase large subunit [Streptomyces]MDX3124933.1 phage terminase large subunit [Streptomyces scabiei]MDX3201853.1 phage terminase large subunit [Streptomyces scabiei]MDX3223108.1 phage terminase large subunit [Streptomyces scabiei]MDX3298661.1 phage terminase large subunit [Streptomyces scabiei]